MSTFKIGQRVFTTQDGADGWGILQCIHVANMCVQLDSEHSGGGCNGTWRCQKSHVYTTPPPAYKEQEDRRARAIARKPEHKVRKGPVKITEGVYNELMNGIAAHDADESEFPDVYVLGMNRDGLIKSIAQVPHDGGCYDMSNVSASDMNSAFVELYKKRVIPCGIARVSGYDAMQFSDEEHRGDSLQQLYENNPNSLYLSAGIECGLIVEGFTRDGEMLKLKYKIVKK